MRKPLAFLGALFVGAALWPQPAEATIVERIVAVVGERPILLSELRHRAKPDLVVMYLQAQNASQASIEETKVYRRVLDHMIEEQLIEQAAQKAHLAVNVDDIDKAVEKKAGELHVTPKELIAEAIREGLSEQDYRDEIRRQILEGKLVQLRVAGRVRVTESDARATYQKWVKEFQVQQPVELHVLAMLIGQNATQQQVAAKDALAQEIAVKARNGEDFCQLVKDYSDHQPSKDNCGMRIVPMKSLPDPVQQQIEPLKDGEFTPPIRFGTGEIDIIQKVRSPNVAPYEQVRDKMMELAGEEAFQHQRDLFLIELRRGVYVDVRLNS